MANAPDAVIELVSSDEETEPPPKRMKLPTIIGKIKNSTVPPIVDLTEDEESPGSPLVGPRSSAATTISKPEQENKTTSQLHKTDEVVITIEDSPVKSSNCFEVGIEQPIIIEDSPLKLTDHCNNKCSDEETSEEEVRDINIFDFPVESCTCFELIFESDSDSNTNDEDVVLIEPKQKTYIG